MAAIPSSATARPFLISIRGRERVNGSVCVCVYVCACFQDREASRSTSASVSSLHPIIRLSHVPDPPAFSPSSLPLPHLHHPSFSFLSVCSLHWILSSYTLHPDSGCREQNDAATLSYYLGCGCVRVGPSLKFPLPFRALSFSLLFVPRLSVRCPLFSPLTICRSLVLQHCISPPSLSQSPLLVQNLGHRAFRHTHMQRPTRELTD